MAGSGAFPKVAGDTVFANDYNTIRNSLNAIYGVGSGTSGYGAEPTTSAVSAYTAINETSWDELRTDILAVRKHQLGAGTTYNTLVAALTNVAAGGTIGIAATNLYKTTVDTAVTNKDTVAATQLTTVTGLSSTYTASWNGAIKHELTVSFDSADDARNFFNAGGVFTLDISATNGSGSKNDDWESIISQVTGSTFDAADYRSGTANVAIVAQTYGSAYGDSYFRAWGHKTSSTTIKFTMLFDDASIIQGELGAPGSGQVFDESVTIDITSSINYKKSFDAIVSPTPSATSAWVNTGFNVVRTDTATAPLTPGFGGGVTPPPPPIVIPPPVPASPTYVLSTPSGPNVNEGSLLTVNVSGTNIVNGTYYWTIQNITTTTGAGGDFNFPGGSVIVTSNAGSFTVDVATDLGIEAAETFRVQLRTGSTSGPVVQTSDILTINSQVAGTPTYNVNPSGTGPYALNEGSSITLFVTGTNIVNGTYYWTILNSTTINADFTAASGTVTVTSNAGSFTVAAVADSSTEGNQVFQVQLRTGSITGTVVDTSEIITIVDTSVGTVTYNEQLTGIGSTFTIGSVLTYAVTGGEPGTNFTYSWSGLKPDGTSYTGLSSATRQLNSSGAYTQSGAFLTGPGTFTFTVVFAGGSQATRSSVTASLINATLVDLGVTSLSILNAASTTGQRGYKITNLTGYNGMDYVGTGPYTATAYGNASSGTLANNNNAQIRIANPHSAGTATMTLTQTNQAQTVLTIAVPAHVVYGFAQFSAEYGITGTTLGYAQGFVYQLYVSRAQYSFPQPDSSNLIKYGLYRNPDAAGLAFWAESRAGGLTQAETEEGFFTTLTVGDADYDRSNNQQTNYLTGTGYNIFFDKGTV